MSETDSKSQKQDKSNAAILEADTKRAVMGGVIAGGAILLGAFVINISSSSEARILLESMLPSIRLLCSAMMTASATILALMLTMLSMSGANKYF